MTPFWHILAQHEPSYVLSSPSVKLESSNNASSHFPNIYRETLHLTRTLCQVDESRIMDSARRPLWLMWTNPDNTVRHIDDSLIRAQVEKNAIIFKYGDGTCVRSLPLSLKTTEDVHKHFLPWCFQCSYLILFSLSILPFNCLYTLKANCALLHWCVRLSIYC